MSKISLSPDASGTGIFTIASPDSNTNRTLTLPDDTGTIVTNSGNQAGSFTTLNTSGAVVFNDAGADVDFRVEGDTEANLLFVDASADAVGIGTSSPSYKLDVQSTSTGTVASFRGSDAGRYLHITSSTTTNNGDTYTLNATSSTGVIAFATDNTERARIDSSGNVGIGSNSPTSRLTVTSDVLGTETALIHNNNASYNDYILTSLSSRNTTNNSYYFFKCRVSGTADRLLIADSGNVTNTNNSYGQISDIKTKQDIVDAASQWDDIKNVRVRKFRFKNDPTGPLQIGVVAQELETVSAGLIEEHPDFEEVEVSVLDDEGNAVLNEDGTPQVTKQHNDLGTTTKAVKYSVLYMKAVKALQEAMERIETLEAKVAALEANNGV